MSSVQAGGYSGTQDAQSGEHLSTTPQGQTHSRSPGSPIEVDDSVISPEVRALLAQDAESVGLEVDEDEDEDGDDEADEVQESARSVYAMSMYPGVGPAYQVEHPYENGQDSATMCVSFLSCRCGERDTGY
jgi:hypothetical protein